MRGSTLTMIVALLLACPTVALAFNTQWAYGNAARYYTEEDWAAEEKAVADALNNKPDGSASEWQGPKAVIVGAAKPLKTYKNKKGQQCRLLELTSKRMEQVDRAAGHFCRAEDTGEWVFVGMAKIKQ